MDATYQTSVEGLYMIGPAVAGIVIFLPKAWDLVINTGRFGVSDTVDIVAANAGTLTFGPSTITFLAIPAAANSACR